MRLFQTIKRLRLGLRLLSALEAIDNDPIEKLTIEDKKLLAIFSTSPTYKSLVRFWRSGVSFVQREAFDNPSIEGIKAADYVIKLENLKRSLIFNYHQSYAKPKPEKTGYLESVVEDLEVLASIKQGGNQKDGDSII